MVCTSALADKKAATVEERFSELTYSEFGSLVFRLARFFRSQGLRPGDRVLVLGGNNPDIVLFHIAAAVAQLVIIPPYVGENNREIQYQLRHGKPAMIAVENRRLLEKLDGYGSMEGIQVLSVRPIARSIVPEHVPLHYLGDVLASDEYEPTVPEWVASITPDDPVLQLYSASDKGHPHAVVHTHGSLLANVGLLHGIGITNEGERSAIILPLGHIYPILVMWLLVLNGLTLVLPTIASEQSKVDVGGIIQCLRDGDSDVIPLVPYFLYLMKSEVEKKYVESFAYFLGVKRKPAVSGIATKQRPVSSKGSDSTQWNLVGFLQFRTIAAAKVEELKKETPQSVWAAFLSLWEAIVVTLTAAAATECLEAARIRLGADYPPGVKPIDYRQGRPLLVHLLWRWLLAPAIYVLTGGVRFLIRKSSFGGRARQLIVGGSRLPYDVQSFWDALGIEVLQGFGTSQTGITHVQRPGVWGKTPEVVGPPLGDSVEQMIDTLTGELCLATPAMMKGYASEGDVSTSVFFLRHGKDWYCTRDTAGFVGNDGTIRITGGLTRMYNSLGGEKVYPHATAEPQIEQSVYVDRAMVWGDAQLFNVAIISPNQEACSELADALGKPVDELYRSEEFVELLMKHISGAVNPVVPIPAKVRSVIIANPFFSRENGMINEDGTINTKVVLEGHQDTLVALYKRPVI
jgi:long-subunit acyl-CoA synthetase (AMP-forming)